VTGNVPYRRACTPDAKLLLPSNWLRLEAGSRGNPYGHRAAPTPICRQVGRRRNAQSRAALGEKTKASLASLSHGTPVEQPSAEVCSLVALLLPCSMTATTDKKQDSEAGQTRHPSRLIIPFSCSVSAFATS
jgi:hypothetical protein